MLRRSSRFRARQRLGVLLAAVLVVLASSATAPASSTGPGSVRVKVTFTGTGTMTVDETYVSNSTPTTACTINTHDVMTLQWTASFDAGVVAGKFGAVTGKLVSSGQGSLTQGPGTFAMTSTISNGFDPYCTAQQIPPCTGSIPSGAPPTLDFSGGDVLKPVTFDAQSATPGPVDSGCGSSGPALAADNDLQVLESSLPGAMTAHGELPAGALVDAGSSSVSVSYASAPTQVPASCPTGVTWTRYITDTACSASMTWSGTVTFKSMCGASNEAPNCIKQHVKKLAAQLAKLDYDLWQGDNWSNSLNCKPHDLTEVGWTTGGAGACVGGGILFYEDRAQYEQEKQIAADPPDAHYRSVAKPHVPRFKQLSKLRSLSPAAYQLLRRSLKITGLTGAVVTAQNRASAAFASLLGGSSGAGGDLAKQNRAELEYAKQAAKLLGGQRKLALRAATQLRAAASHLQAEGSSVSAKDLRLLAAALVSKRAAHADRLTATVLKGIGR